MEFNNSIFYVNFLAIHNIIIMDNKINVDVAAMPWAECTGGNKLFDKKYLYKKLSPLVSPTGKAELFPLEVLVCTKCGKVPKFFYEKAKDFPEDLKSDCDKILIEK
jgi:hypothetical protein